MLPDYHIHTRFSVDSDADLDAICETALARGLNEIGLVDHCDFEPEDSGYNYLRLPERQAAVEACRARYAPLGLTVRAGIEIGETHLFPEETAATLAAADFDYLIGSAHYADGLQKAWEADFFDQPLDQAYAAYFRQTVRLAAEGDYDVLAHLDLVKRDAFKFGRPYDPQPYAGMLREALGYVISRGKGIELNTSPWVRGQPEPCPSLDLLRWYRRAGGQILVFGSDAHVPEDVGGAFERARELAMAAGFTRLARFERRQVTGWMEL